MFLAFFAFVLLLFYGYFLFDSSEKKVRPLTCSLMVSGDGYCRFDRGPVWKLSVSSRVGFAGCWLVLTDELLTPPVEKSRLQSVAAMPEAVVSSRFFFKDSLSAQDFARLSRVILSLKKHQQRTAISGGLPLK
ncbi:hypothetical protein SG34_005420 [Thalassomonas viridans]|uniref:Uncharacterized protein n=1 Tax=Thalassomonas viridans TaxID=137584 RepID=A0AAE9Z4B4_9GAMM|nr:hypothetical protein [Thalassomonas viridans]WDE06363.1 hypothetical protein SG34_005420 [Thalassomonas viridans]